MSTENRKKVLVGFGAFAVVLIAVLAIWRPPAFRSEDASGSIGTVQKYHAPQITQQDVVLGDETTRHEQQIRYADFLNDAAKLHSLSSKITADNRDAASRDIAAMKAELAGRYQAEAKAAVAAAQALARESSNKQAESKVAELSAILENGQLSDAQMANFNTKLAALSNQFAVKTAAERAQAANHEVAAALSEMRTNQANATAKMDGALSELKAINAISLADRADFLKATEMESRELARESDVLGKMAAKPMAENQAAARAFDGTASQLEMMAAKAMDRQLGLIIVVCSSVRDIDAKLAEARGAVANKASAAGRSQVYDNALASASQAFAGAKTQVNALANAGVNAQLSAINSYLDSAAQAGVKVANVRTMENVLASLSNQLAGNSVLAASLADRNEVAMRTAALADRAQNAQKSQNAHKAR